MRRGQTRPEPTPPGQRAFTKAELIEAAGISAGTFDTIRKAARVRGPSHGGLTWPFSQADVIELIHRAESGSFTERGRPAASAWRALLDAPPDREPPDEA
ncbi:MAG: hypothetical protein JNK35_02600 [Phycisphaerae bacterium]|nr:hypothetical protein [Phycisphaerae bacterium]